MNKTYSNIDLLKIILKWKKHLAIIAVCSVALSILFWGLISLYLGSTYNPVFYQSQINLIVVNFDTGNQLGEGIVLFF